jgi:FAD/FMN-containing dehydrogenase
VRPAEVPADVPTNVNYNRLREIKAKYDPQNLFHVNQNIKPH